MIEIVKNGLKRFCTVLDHSTTNNVDIIIDVNQHNDHPLFSQELERAQQGGGRFRGVNRITRIDSAASRLLQLADVVAYARKWIVAEERNAQGLPTITVLNCSKNERADPQDSSLVREM